jgi:hypothetical protein
MMWFVQFVQFVRYGNWKGLNPHPGKSNESHGSMTRHHPEPETQKALAAHDEIRAAGVEIAVAVGIDQAPAQLEGWGLLRRRFT